MGLCNFGSLVARSFFFCKKLTASIPSRDVEALALRYHVCMDVLHLNFHIFINDFHYIARLRSCSLGGRARFNSVCCDCIPDRISPLYVWSLVCTCWRNVRLGGIMGSDPFNGAVEQFLVDSDDSIQASQHQCR